MLADPDDTTSALTPSAILVWSEIFRRGGYGRNHPLSVPRVPLTYDLIRSYDAVTPAELREAGPADEDALHAFHTSEYLAAYQSAQRHGRVASEARERHALGTLENPYFPGFFTVPATAAQGSIVAAEAVIEGGCGFNPAGGMHHARADRACGFCFLNDAVLAVLRLRRAGARVLYLDLDAHHGDGVEEAFRADPHVLTVSLHMDTSYAYPFRGGTLADQGGPANRHATVNVPLPQRTHDAEYRLVFDAVWERLLARFRPDALVVQAGADALVWDPLARLDLSTQCFLGIVGSVLETAPRSASGIPRVAMLGGGGYHPVATARAWCGVWALMSGRTLAQALPAAAVAHLRATDWECGDEDEVELYVSRLDQPRPAPVRPRIHALAAELLRHPFLSAA